jgi:hypothetical protein
MTCHQATWKHEVCAWWLLEKCIDELSGSILSSTDRETPVFVSLCDDRASAFEYILFSQHHVSVYKLANACLRRAVCPRQEGRDVADPVRARAARGHLGQPGHLVVGEVCAPVRGLRHYVPHRLLLHDPHHHRVRLQHAGQPQKVCVLPQPRVRHVSPDPCTTLSFQLL